MCSLVIPYPQVLPQRLSQETRILRTSPLAVHDHAKRLQGSLIVRHLDRNQYSRLVEAEGPGRRYVGGSAAGRVVTDCIGAAVGVGVPWGRKGRGSTHVGSTEHHEVAVTVGERHLGTPQPRHLDDALGSSVAVTMKGHDRHIGCRQIVVVTSGEALRLIIRSAPSKRKQSENVQGFNHMGIISSNYIGRFISDVYAIG